MAVAVNQSEEIVLDAKAGDYWHGNIFAGHISGVYTFSQHNCRRKIQMKMMKKLAAALVGGAICLSLAACGASGDKAYPVKINGTEIIVGESTVGVLYDAGFTIEALSSKLRSENPLIEATDELEKNRYYSSINVLKDDKEVAVISIVTGKTDTPAADAIIGKVEFDASLSHPLDTVTFDGILVPNLSADVFKEHVSGAEVRDDGTSAYFVGKNYLVRAYYENGVLVQLEIERKYDVDFKP